MGKMSILAAAVLAASGTSAIAGTGFEWGGDVRFRIESIGDVSTHTNGTIDQLFNRDRIRLWASYAPDENIIFKAEYSINLEVGYIKNYAFDNNIFTSSLVAKF